jgi:GxxExxY protein
VALIRFHLNLGPTERSVNSNQRHSNQEWLLPKVKTGHFRRSLKRRDELEGSTLTHSRARCLMIAAGLRGLRAEGIPATKAPSHEGPLMSYAPVSQREEAVARHIVNAAYMVHKRIGPGLLERVYEVCFCHELKKAGLSFQRQVDIPIVYDGLVFDEALRLDVLVEDCVICELKAVEEVNPVWEAQILSHLKLTGKRLEFLINFNVPLIKSGIRRFVV